MKSYEMGFNLFRITTCFSHLFTTPACSGATSARTAQSNGEVPSADTALADARAWPKGKAFPLGCGS
jgi:hypothetical protein